MLLNSRRRNLVATVLVALLALEATLHLISNQQVNCAPNGNAGANSGNKSSPRPRFFSSLFRRQTSSSSGSTSTAAPSTSQSSSDNNEEPQNQIEADAQKFMDSLPNPSGNDKERPTTFRGRFSETFGVLREAASNHFKTVRENWSDTMEDIRDTWSPNSSDNDNDNNNSNNSD